MDPFKTSYTEPNIKSNIISSTSSKSNNKTRASSIKVDFDILSNMDKMKFIDTSLNKFYTKYLQQQAFIQHDQKIYEIIEKSDEPKIFNTLRNNYIREKNELKNMTNIHSDTRKVTDIISFVNLNNCKKKLYSIYKLSADDLGFMTSFMHHLGHRPKKIIKQKVNKKLEAYKGYLIFEGQYFLNGILKVQNYFNTESLLDKWDGKLMEYQNGELIFEGDYLNGKRWNGKGKEYDFRDGKIRFDGEFLDGKKWDGKWYSDNNSKECEIKNGNGNESVDEECLNYEKLLEEFLSTF